MAEDHNYNHVSDPADLEGNEQGSLSLSTSGAETSALPRGVYDVWASASCYIKVGATANDVTTSTGYLLYAGNMVPVVVRKDRKLGGIVASGTATLYYHKVG